MNDTMESDQSFAMAISPHYEQRLHVETKAEMGRVTEVNVDLSPIVEEAPHGYEETWWIKWDADTRILNLSREEPTKIEDD